MILTKEQRITGMKYNLLSMLILDVQDKRYDELQQIYETLNFRDNDKLVEKLSHERNISAFFTENIYYDMIQVISDHLVSYGELFEVFETLYSGRYSGVRKVIEDLKIQYEKFGQINSTKKMKFSGKEAKLFYYYIYKTEAFQEPEKILKGFDYYRDEKLLKYLFFTSDKNLVDDQLIFCANREESIGFLSGQNRKDCETVLDSIFFKRYLNKRRVALAEFLNVEESHLAEKIHGIMKSQADDQGAPIRSGIEGLIETFVKNIIANNNGGVSWYNDMTGTFASKGFKRGIAYVPDVDLLIENYYKSYVTTRYTEELEKNNGFSKITLSRECIPANVENDYHMILCMYEMQVLYKMFDIMQVQYYKHFSWEKITNQDLSERYEVIISNLQQIIGEKEKQISELSARNSSLSLQKISDEAKKAATFVVENNKLQKQIEEKDNIIAELKKKLQYQEEFIDELNRMMDDFQGETSYDLTELQSKRFLFVGHIQEVLPELKHKFPNSLFMESESFNLAGIKVDAVVMLVKWMSHSMFYKIKETKDLEKIKIVMCNLKNLDMIYQSMYDALQ